ncbi:PHB depolymerase family esterase [Cupriavidus necator]|uniref:extracellular catalytic domain type 1 short-chain-length polyhydroxyalkanoate depolymerase n=1 Tax=Cupriavidus necator TaxID=106590 RepID=UPI0039C24B87
MDIKAGNEPMSITCKGGGSHAVFTAELLSSKQASRWVNTFLLTLLLALPMTASAASWWCSFLPFLPGCVVATGPLIEVTGFGSNPGNLKMFKYLPANLGASRPLVVALHGCKQQASDYDDEPDWIKFADKHRFALLLPEQQLVNNSSKCFNWFLPGHNERDKGEALSIKQMFDKIKTDANIDPQKVYVTGLSAGGGMTAVMLAAYPELFAGGAIIAGIPYKCAKDATEALNQCGVSLSGQLAPIKNLTPPQWGSLVRNASGHNGPFPRVSIWQGTSDITVNPQDQKELVDQWANVLGIDQIPDTEGTINGHAHKLYKDNNGKALVETVLINGMGHGTPIDPGNADSQCGKAAPFILSVGVCSSFYIVKFWGLDGPNGQKKIDPPCCRRFLYRATRQ